MATNNNLSRLEEVEEAGEDGKEKLSDEEFNNEENIPFTTTDQPIPGYLRHTLSSLTTSACSSESEQIKKSFRSGSFYSIKQLPSRFVPGGIIESRRINIANSLSNKPSRTYRAHVVPNYFTPITYSRTEYNKVAENEREEAQFQRLTTLSFSRKPFTYSSSKVRLKNEDIFGNEEYKYPILGPGRGITELSSFVRQDFTNAEKMIHGPFFVLGKGRDREASRDDIYNWCREIYEKIAMDWSHLRYHIQVVDGEEIVISFELNTLRGNEKSEGKDSIHEGGLAEAALCRYMGTISRHGIAAERRLRKRGDRWRVIEWIETKPTSNKKDSINELSNDMTEVVVYSFFAPWVTSAQHKAHNYTAKTNRLKTRDQVREKNETYVQSRITLEKDALQSSPIMASPSPIYGSARKSTDRSFPVVTSVPSSDKTTQIGVDTSRS